MGIEIERKFLVKNDNWRTAATGTQFRQGYLCLAPERTVRVRLEGDVGKLTIKGRTEGLSRAEYEYQIPAAEAAELLDSLCLQPLIEKIRYRIEHAGRSWEIDEFSGDNQGLILAELELETENAIFELPDWVGKEVSDDPRYYNARLVNNPFKSW